MVATVCLNLKVQNVIFSYKPQIALSGLQYMCNRSFINCQDLYLAVCKLNINRFNKPKLKALLDLKYIARKATQLIQTGSRIIKTYHFQSSLNIWIDSVLELMALDL